MHGGAPGSALALAVTVALASACGFDSSGAGGPRGDGGGGGTIDGGGGIDGGDGTIDGGGEKADADVVASTFCQGGGALEACYELDGNLEDSSQNNNDLTGSNVTYATGKDGQALVTTQSSKMAAIKTATLDFSDELTIEAYLMPSQEHDRWAIDHQAQWGLVLDDDKVSCTIVIVNEDGTDGHTVTSEAGSVPEDEWTHVACTYDGTAIILYIDGVPAGSPLLVTGTIDTAPNDGFTIGRDAPEGESWLGRIDSVRIWSVARTDQQILGSL